MRTGSISVAVVSILALSGVASAQTGAPGTPTPPAKGTQNRAEPMPDMSAFQAVTDRVREMGSTDPAFAAVSVDVNADTATVYRTTAPTSVSMSDYEAAASPPVRVVEARALLSKVDVERIDGKVVSLLPGLDAQDIRLVSWGARYADKPYVIVYDSKHKTPTAAVEAEFSEFGAGNVVFQPGAAPVPVDRQYDSSPFYAGAAIHGPHGANGLSRTCTSNVNGISDTTHKYYAITPYHCILPDDPRFWTNPTSSGGNYFGKVTVQESGHDTAWVNLTDSGTYGLATAWDGVMGAESITDRVTGSFSISGGLPICVTGAYTGSKCGSHVGGTGSTSIRIPNLYTGQQFIVSPVWFMEKDNGSNLIAGGDSGGLVYQSVTGGIQVGGMISAGDPAAGDASCPSGKTGPCYWAGYFVPINTIIAGKNFRLTGTGL